MSNKKINSGDLIYVPTGVYLYNRNKDGEVVGYKKLKEPANLLVTSVKEKQLRVLHRKEEWLVDKAKVALSYD